MKLHLPVRLFRAIILLMCSTTMSLYAAYVAPSEIVIPDKYDTEVTATRTGDILGHTGSNVAFLLANDISVENLTIALKSKSDSSWLFTSNEASTLADICISGATVQLFNLSSGQTLAFDSFNSVDFTQNLVSANVYKYGSSKQTSAGGAVYSNGNVLFSNVYDVLFNNNEARSYSGTASGSYDEAFGGAIYSNEINLIDNFKVHAKNNTAEADAWYYLADSKRLTAKGGAFWAYNIEIFGNDQISGTASKKSRE